MRDRQLLHAATCVLAILVGAGCDQLRRWSDLDLEMGYLGDESGFVDRASVSTDTKVIASARRVGVRRTDGPGITELDVEETHYVRGTLEVVYTGQIVFRCDSAQGVCDRIHVEPTSGTRPRDIFRRWPLRIGGPHVHPALPPRARLWRPRSG